MLDQTLQRMIQRFEDEYPETKVPDSIPPAANGMPSPNPSVGDTSILSASVESNGLATINSAEEYFPGEDGAPAERNAKLSRTPSNTSLASKLFTDEEGRMHRFGQNLRREVLKPTGVDDHLHGTSTDDAPELESLAVLRSRLEELGGEEIRQQVERNGADNVVRQLGINAQELLIMKREDPIGFEAFSNSQLAAQINSGRYEEKAVQE